MSCRHARGRFSHPRIFWKYQEQVKIAKKHPRYARIDCIRTYSKYQKHRSRFFFAVVFYFLNNLKSVTILMHVEYHCLNLPHGESSFTLMNPSVHGPRIKIHRRRYIHISKQCFLYRTIFAFSYRTISAATRKGINCRLSVT